MKITTVFWIWVQEKKPWMTMMMFQIKCSVLKLYSFYLIHLSQIMFPWTFTGVTQSILQQSSLEATYIMQMHNIGQINQNMASTRISAYAGIGYFLREIPCGHPRSHQTVLQREFYSVKCVRYHFKDLYNHPYLHFIHSHPTQHWLQTLVCNRPSTTY